MYNKKLTFVRKSRHNRNMDKTYNQNFTEEQSKQQTYEKMCNLTSSQYNNKIFFFDFQKLSDKPASSDVQ